MICGNTLENMVKNRMFEDVDLLKKDVWAIYPQAIVKFSNGLVEIDVTDCDNRIVLKMFR